MNIYDFSCKLNNNDEISLSQYKDTVLLIVNTASKCGFTDQYKDLETLYKKYKDAGFSVLAFPCDQFLNQEFSSNEEIKNFCTINFGITFPVFEKIKVNGTNAHKLFLYLQKELPGLLGITSIKWNFTKFLIDSKGNPIKRYAPSTSISDIEPDLKKLLK